MKSTDRIISNYPYIAFGKLAYCYENKLSYMFDFSNPIEYKEDYFNEYLQRENTEIADKINNFRCSLTEKYCNCVLDVGIGAGTFIKRSKIKTYGFDVNPVGVKWLRDKKLFVDPYEDIPKDVSGFTLWDVLEHMTCPTEFLDLIKDGQ